jgi:conjugal transfer/entry exclusion protein
MKRKMAVLAMVLGIAVNRGAAAQGYPVMDITAIVAAIENGYTMVQQLQTMYNTLKATHDQLQEQIKNFEAFDLKSLDAKDPLGSWRSLVTYADRILTYEENIEAIINKKDVKIGGGTYSLSDIFKSPASIVGNAVTGGVNYILDPFETKLSPEEKAVFHQKYGMSYGNYMRINQMREMLKRKSVEVFAYSGRLQDDLAEDRERLNTIANEMEGSKSAVQQQQITNAMISIMAQDIKTQSNLLGSIANQLAAAAAQAQIEKQAMEEELNINNLDIAEGFLKMLDGMPSADKYR